MRQLLTMTASDLRQRVRDRSVLIFGLVVPLALMTVLNLVMPSESGVEIEPTTVAASWSADDPAAVAVVQALGAPELEVTVHEVGADEVSGAVADGDADMGLVLPSGFGQALASGEGPRVRIVDSDSSGTGGLVVSAVVRSVVDAMNAEAVATRAGTSAGLEPERAQEVAREAATTSALTLTEGSASDEQLGQGAALVAGQAGLFLLFTVGFGVLALTEERQQGTLARLRSMPMRPGLIVAAKGLVSFILGVAATSVLLTAGALLFDVDFGSVAAVAALVLCVACATTSLMFIVVRVARTAEQAGIVQTIVAMVLGVAGGAFFPVSAPGVLSGLLDLNPIAAFTRGLGITSGGGGLGDIGVPVAIMLCFAVVCLAVSRILPDRGAAA